jgi:HAD superfamily hydrolase (TIGR01509 family)
VTPELVIFDCDGVLVDSEPIANRVLAELLTAEGYPITAEQCEERFTGLRFRAVYGMVEAELGRPLPQSLKAGVHGNILAAFRTGLRPLPGVGEAVRSIPLRRCVASSSAPDWIRTALEVTGLLPLFEPHLFSAVMVEHGKPHPDLFLYAAETMGAAPERCLVIEDSVAGVSAAVAAGMRVIGFTGGGHAHGPAYRAKLAAAGARTIVDRFEGVDLLALAAAG